MVSSLLEAYLYLSSPYNSRAKSPKKLKAKGQRGIQRTRDQQGLRVILIQDTTKGPRCPNAKGPRCPSAKGPRREILIHRTKDQGFNYPRYFRANVCTVFAIAQGPRSCFYPRDETSGCKTKVFRNKP